MANEDNDQTDRAEIIRLIEDGHDDAERNGCVTPEELRRSLDDAKERGLLQRKQRLTAARLADVDR